MPSDRTRRPPKKKKKKGLQTPRDTGYNRAARLDPRQRSLFGEEHEREIRGQ